METYPPRKRGRPAGPTSDALGEYLRRLRTSREMTVRDLARAVGLPVTSAAYISQLESGLKVPSPELAAALARALGDKSEVFHLWSQTAKRSGPERAAHARQELARLLDDPSLAHNPHFMSPMLARVEQARDMLMARLRGTRGLEERAKGEAQARWRAMPSAPPESRAMASMEETMGMRDLEGAHRRRREMAARSDQASPEDTALGLSVPLLPEGADPDHVLAEARLFESRPESVRIAPEVLRASRAVKPIAYRLTAAGVRRVSGILRPGDIAIISREPAQNVVAHEIYAVRLRSEVVLSLLMWNGRDLLVLPDVDEDDFEVLPAASPQELGRHIVGHVATVVRGAEVTKRG